ncbi:bifunctional protein-serine/threonine kinase/phosphatase [Thiohalobacter sp.]|uniref:bifunctional protein-serine/threonine kinase/phosphatase n=1 Tax=Thiohalobacter sp. TaxID=2025948 RepID=UPI00262AC99B|nr:bifunctional protein-serine/threonine kinase/phosphatase [Thiohalobacter sp.]
MTQLRLSAAQRSEAGLKPVNEDSVGIQIPDPPLLTSKGAAAVIADGMSGSEGGREAAEACVTGFLSDYFSTPESWSVETSGEKILGALNRWLYGQGQQRFGNSRGLVTTLSVLVIKSHLACLFHVGDTRIYRFRDGELEPLTQDHNLVVGGDKTCLSRAMGVDPHLDIDYSCQPVETGDLFLLTTDGVHGFLPDARLRELLQRHGGNLETAADRIIEAALAAGSNDNLSVQLLRIDALPEANDAEFYRQLTALPFPPPLAPGMKLDGFRILRELHASNRTQVYLAEREGTGERVALKTPSVNFEDDPLYIDQFLHEEWAGRRLNSPHLLKVLPPPDDRQCLYSVTELVEGQTLRAWMDDHPQPPLSEVRDIARQIAQGLRVMHRQEMIHQDLKPENVMIDRDGLVKIIDFGSTKIAGIAEIRTPLERDRLLGTRDYTAPEYLLGHPGSNRSDIYSLGVVVYEMLTGHLPYAHTPTARNLKRLRYRSARHFNPEIPDWMDGALQKAVHPDPARRYERLSEFIHDISQPNDALVPDAQLPLIERNPLGFWKALALLSLAANLLLLILLAS